MHAKTGDSSEVTALLLRKRGRPLMLREALDTDVQKYIRALRLAGTPVSSSLVLAAVEGIVVSKDRTLLAYNGGHVMLTKWALSLLNRMGYVKQKASTKNGKRSDKQFELKRRQFLLDISGMVKAHIIPDELVLNWDQTGLNLVPSGNWTFEKRGQVGLNLLGRMTYA